MTQTAININSIQYRLDNPRPLADLAVLIRAKQKRIEAIQGWASPQTMERERAELAKLEEETR